VGRRGAAGKSRAKPAFVKLILIPQFPFVTGYNSCRDARFPSFFG
jgi:hypothetical protein